jgi:hypothetical protein
MTCTALYLMRNTWSEANYKVGISKSPGRRQAEVIFTYDVEPVITTTAWFTSKHNAQEAERSWHRFLEEYRTDDHGGKEWFSLPTDKLHLFKQWASISSPVNDLRYWLHQVGASRHEQDSYDYSLLKKIPRKRKRHQTIDVWKNKDL